MHINLNIVSFRAGVLVAGARAARNIKAKVLWTVSIMSLSFRNVRCLVWMLNLPSSTFSFFTDTHLIICFSFYTESRLSHGYSGTSFVVHIINQCHYLHYTVRFWLTDSTFLALGLRLSILGGNGFYVGISWNWFVFHRSLRSSL